MGVDVFCCTVAIIYFPSLQTISFQRRFSMSLNRKAEQHENRQACLTISLRQSVSISVFISSIVRYCRFDSGFFTRSAGESSIKGFSPNHSARSAAERGVCPVVDGQDCHGQGRLRQGPAMDGTDIDKKCGPEDVRTQKNIIFVKILKVAGLILGLQTH